MLARKGTTFSAVAVLAVAGGMALGGCGGSSDDSQTTRQANNAAATTSGDAAMKDHGAMHDGHGEAMKDDGAMKHEG
jgi:hypothetical protein